MQKYSYDISKIPRKNLDNFLRHDTIKHIFRTIQEGLWYGMVS